MRMEQRQAAELCANSLYHIAQTEAGIRQMVKHLTPLEELEDALAFFKSRDDRCYSALVNLRNYHFTGYRYSRRGERTARFEMHGANSTWRTARTLYGDIARSTIERLDEEASKRAVAEGIVTATEPLRKDIDS